MNITEAYMTQDVRILEMLDIGINKLDVPYYYMYSKEFSHPLYLHEIINIIDDYMKDSKTIAMLNDIESLVRVDAIKFLEKHNHSMVREYSFESKELIMKLLKFIINDLFRCYRGLGIFFFSPIMQYSDYDSYLKEIVTLL